MGGRAYDYNLGRFLSVDPIITEIADPQSINPYGYVRNNPLNATDPSGYDEEDSNRRPDTPPQDSRRSGSRSSDRRWERARRAAGAVTIVGVGTVTTTPSSAAREGTTVGIEIPELSSQLGRDSFFLNGGDSSALEDLELDHGMSDSGDPRSGVDLSLQGTVTSEVSGLPGAQNYLPEMTPEEMAVQIVGGAAIVGGVGAVAYGPAALAGVSTGVRTVAARVAAWTHELFFATGLSMAPLRDLGPNLAPRLQGLSQTAGSVLRLVVNNRFVRTPKIPRAPRFPTGFKPPVPRRGPPRPPHWDMGPNWRR